MLGQQTEQQLQFTFVQSANKVNKIPDGRDWILNKFGKFAFAHQFIGRDHSNSDRFSNKVNIQFIVRVHSSRGWISNDLDLVGLKLNSNSLKGSTRKEFRLLLKLWYLDFSYNALWAEAFQLILDLYQVWNICRWVPLSGSIFTETGNLTYMEDLELSSNFLHGRIPSEIGYLSSLTNLLLSFNSLSLCILSSLTILALPSKSLIGSIPTQFGQLRILYFSAIKELVL